MKKQMQFCRSIKKSLMTSLLIVMIAACQSSPYPSGTSGADWKIELEKRTAIEGLDNALRTQRPDEYAGLYLAGSDLDYPVVRMKNAEQGQFDGFDSQVNFRIEDADYSIAELESIQHFLFEKLVSAQFEGFLVGVDVKQNRVTLRVPDLAAFSSMVERENIAIGDEVIQMEASVVLASNRRAGAKIRGPVDPSTNEYPICTAGFTALDSNGVRGGTTAGHCLQGIWYETSTTHTIPSTIFKNEGDLDIQWGSRAADTYLNEVYQSPAITAVNLGALQQIDDQVCKYGRTTGYDCGVIIETNSLGYHNGVAGRFMVAENVKQHMAKYGDSGGPVMNGSIAMGMIHAMIPKGNGHPCNLLVYITPESFTAVGLTIATTL